MDNFEVQERLRFLQVQISRLRAANEAYLKQRSHPSEEVIAYRRRKERLQSILEELAEIRKKIKAA
jgi:cell fate (sporulation/competence/biofilm development) regulator YlbF (YheA/YmcA/DUF963 family)